MHDTTLCRVLGDWFAWLALATLAFTLVQLYRLRENLHKMRVLDAKVN